MIKLSKFCVLLLLFAVISASTITPASAITEEEIKDFFSALIQIESDHIVLTD